MTLTPLTCLYVTPSLRRLLLIVLVLMSVASGPRWALLASEPRSNVAATEHEKRAFEIPGSDAATALKRFFAQCGAQLIYKVESIEGLQTRAVKGRFTPREALEHLLAGTPLRVQEDETTGVLAIAPSPAPRTPDPRSSTTIPKKADSMTMKNPLALLFGWAALVFTTSGSAQDLRATLPPGSRGGTIIGTVSSADTRSMLQGATVSLPAQRLQALTDNTGRFVLTDVAPGASELVVAYTGFDDQRQSVVVSLSEPARIAVEMKTYTVFTLEAFTVSTEREGHALAVTEQRNASNVKNVMAMDALGNLPTSNIGELLVQMPGISGILDVEGNVSAVSVRGMASGLTQLSIDGLPSTNVTLMSFSGGMYEQLEVIKGQTPDRSADSIGGMINLKSRPTLGMAEKRRITYNLSARWAPPFFERTTMRALHSIHPLTNIAYQEVFDVRGGQRNLGISLGVSYNENANDRDYLLYDYRNSDQLPNFIWDYRTTSGYNRRHVTSANVKAEYRHSDVSKFELSLIYNHGDEPGYETVDTRAFTNQVVATVGANGLPTGTGGIMPGFTNTFTEVRGVAASFFEINSRSVTFFKRNPIFTFTGEQKLGRLDIDYSARYSQYLTYSDAGKKDEQGELVMRVPNVGYTLNTADPSKPVFTQTAGADIYDIDSYTSNISYTMRDTTVDLRTKNFESNAKYRFETAYPFELKGGISYREDTRDQEANPRTWTRVAGAPSLPTSWMSLVKPRLFGDGLPVLQPRVINPELSNPALWTQNLYTTQMQQLTNNYQVSQEVKSAYLMGRGKFHRLGYLAGVRFERTEVAGAGNIRGILATAAQIPDPVQRAINDYANRVTHEGSYDRSFPSVHAYYEFTNDFIARASWSTSFGRANLNALSPTATINDTNQTVSARNPGIGPQYAENIDLSLEYYFRPAGMVSAGYFKKDIKDYIITTQVGVVGDGPNNGFDGLYSGYTLSSTVNAGTAKVEGWEFNYRQQLTFLPGLLRGIGLSANFTELKTEGNYGSGPALRTSEVAGFIPRTANLSVTYNYKKFGTKVGLAYNGEYLSTYNAAETARYYRMSFTTVNLGVSYRLSSKLTLYCDATNVTEEPLRFYRYVPAQFRQDLKMQTAVIFGVAGRF